VTETLSAFIDGEVVDTDELASALAEPGAREALVDFVLLRQELREGGDPPADFVRRTRDRLRGATSPPWAQAIRWAAAAVIATLALLGALDLGGLALSQRVADRPPDTTRELRFEPGVDWQAVAVR